MKLAVTIEIVRKEKWYLARIPELDFGSQGRTPGGASQGERLGDDANSVR